MQNRKITSMELGNSFTNEFHQNSVIPSENIKKASSPFRYRSQIRGIINEDSYDSYTKFMAEKLDSYIFQKDLEKELTNLFSRLEDKQQPLGHKFEEILIQNLWNLYDD